MSVWHNNQYNLLYYLIRMLPAVVVFVCFPHLPLFLFQFGIVAEDALFVERKPPG